MRNNFKKSAIKTLFKRAETRLIYQLKTMLTQSFIAGCLAASAIAIGVPMYIPENYEAIEKYESALAQTTSLYGKEPCANKKDLIKVKTSKHSDLSQTTASLEDPFESGFGQHNESFSLERPHKEFALAQTDADAEQLIAHGCKYDQDLHKLAVDNFYTLYSATTTTKYSDSKFLPNLDSLYWTDMGENTTSWVQKGSLIKWQRAGAVFPNNSLYGENGVDQ